MISTTRAIVRGLLPAEKLPLLLLLGFAAFWISCFAGTADLANWYIENLLVVLFMAALLISRRWLVLNNGSYVLIFLFLLLHTYGAKYAYADNPLGFALQNTFHLARNPYDRIVHFSFGFLLSLPMRDAFCQTWRMSRRSSWILPVEVTLSLSGLFELVEWSIADVFFPAHGKNYVGTQGDVWDAQKDMALATFGALLMMLTASAIQRIRRRNSI